MKSLKEMILIAGRRLRDDQLSNRRDLIRWAVEGVDARKDFLAANVNDVESRLESGKVRKIDLRRAQSELYALSQESLKGGVLREATETAISQELDIHRLLERHITEEVQIVERSLDRLRIIAPAEGRVRSIVPKGLFVERGDVLLEIY